MTTENLTGKQHAKTRHINFDPVFRGRDYAKGKNQPPAPRDLKYHMRNGRYERRIDREANVESKERSIGELLMGEIRDLYRFLTGKY